MKKSITLLAILSLSIFAKAQTTPQNVSIPVSQVQALYARIDTVSAWLQGSELKGSQITWLISKLEAGKLPITTTIQTRFKAIKDSTDKANAKPKK